ncbi:MAG: 3-deoxy-D-manno-octulosonic acid transferase [Chthoniobacterales bacterium]|nr:3-deoxy-D-manno-octulosonic acid transferase [Chthoniobacterales bacterium]
MSASTGSSPAGIIYDAAWGAVAAVCRPALGFARLREARGSWIAAKLGIHAPAGDGPCCWIHACSVGEVAVALRCIAALRAARPGLRFVLTTVTPEGRILADRSVSPPDRVEWFPFDARSAIRRAYDAFRPEFVVLVEVELWPNHLREACERDIPVFVVNARLSGNDERNYRRAGAFIRRIFALPELVCARSMEDASRFQRLGARNVVVTGDMKLDPPPRTSSGSPADSVILPDAPVLLGASTHPGEEDVLMDVFQSCRRAVPDLVLVLVPRHPARAGTIRAAASRHGFRVASGSETAPDCWVVDAIGHLPRLYSMATVAFVGKSLTARGGQNFVEAVEAGCPVVIGPHMDNFAGTTHAFLSANAVLQVHDAESLALAAETLLLDPGCRELLITRATAVLRNARGATQRTVQRLLDQLGARTDTSSGFTVQEPHGKEHAE